MVRSNQEHLENIPFDYRDHDRDTRKVATVPKYIISTETESARKAKIARELKQSNETLERVKRLISHTSSINELINAWINVLDNSISVS